MKVKKSSKKSQKFNVRKPILVVGILSVLLIVSAFKIYKALNTPDLQCKIQHSPSVSWPARLKTAGDYLQQGDYLYEKGDCSDAITAYTRAISLSSKYGEAYNNRAYTYMRMGEYQKALLDLNKAIELRPDYTHALMNRGDIYNYYLIDRASAIADYNRVLEIEDHGEKSLCWHRLLALNNGWNLNTFWQILTKGIKAGCV